MIYRKADEPLSSSSLHEGLLEAIRCNDEHALKKIYTENFPAAERYILLNNGSEEMAKDIYQEAFIAMWQNIRLDRFLPQNESSLKNYLLRIVKNKWLDHLRSSQYRNTTRLDENYDADIKLSPQEDIERLDRIKKHLAALGSTCREVLRRFYYEKQSLKQIADAFKWTEATARNNKYRCVERLRKGIQQK